MRYKGYIMKNNILITGSSSGIGKATKEKLIHDGYHVLGISRRENGVDFSHISSLEEKLKSLAKENAGINTLILNAGYGEIGNLEQMSVKQMQRQMDVNFLSHVIVVKTFLSHLKKQSNSKIIFIGSESALNGGPKGAIYCASKFALRGFSQSLRIDLAKNNIAVSMINPGFVRTPFFDELDFEPGDNQSNAIEAKQVADIISHIMKMDNNCVLEEINLQPITPFFQKSVAS